MSHGIDEHFITAKLIGENNNNSIKNHLEAKQTRPRIVITKCLSEPCPVYYTDTLSESILVECHDPRHNVIEKQVVEGGKGCEPPTPQQQQLWRSPEGML